MKNRTKITLLVAALLVVSIAGLYANGQMEKNFEKKESVSLTGNIVFKNRIFSELTASGKTYLLLVPHFVPNALKIKDGDQVTVTGNIVVVKDSSRIRGFDGITDQLVSVEKLTFGGKDYTVNDLKDYMKKHPYGPKGGRRGWMMGGDGWMMRGTNPEASPEPGSK